MKGYILKSQDETIAVIKETHPEVLTLGSDSGDTLTMGGDDFINHLKVAVAEHYCCEVSDVTVDTPSIISSRDGVDEWFDIETIEDGEESLRGHTLQEVYIY